MALDKSILIDILGRRHGHFSWRAFTGTYDLSVQKNLTLVFMDGKLGDSIVNSALIDGIRLKYPSLPIWVFSLESVAEYWRSHPDVEKVEVLPESNATFRTRISLHQLGKRYQGSIGAVVAFEPMATLEQFLLLAAMKPDLTVGFLKHEYRLFDVSLLDFTYGQEKRSISTRIDNLLTLFEASVPYAELVRHVPCNDAGLGQFHAKYGLLTDQNLVLVNGYGSNNQRTFSASSLRIILAIVAETLPMSKIVLNISREQISNKEEVELMNSFGSKLVILDRGIDLFELFSAIASCDFVITPDTGPAHVAAALRKPVLTFFADHEYNPVVWMPIGRKCECVLSLSGKNINDQDWSQTMLKIQSFLCMHSCEKPMDSEFIDSTTTPNPSPSFVRG